MEVTIPTALLTRSAEVALGGGLSVLTVWSLTRDLRQRVQKLEELPAILGRELARIYQGLQAGQTQTAEETGRITQTVAALERVHGQAIEQQAGLINAVQQAQVQLATSDQQQEAALVDLGERISRQSEVLARLVEQLQQRPPVQPADPWAPPELQERIASLRQEFNNRRSVQAQAFSAPTPEEGQ